MQYKGGGEEAGAGEDDEPVRRLMLQLTCELRLHGFTRLFSYIIYRLCIAVSTIVYPGYGCNCKP